MRFNFVIFKLIIVWNGFLALSATDKGIQKNVQLLQLPEL